MAKETIPTDTEDDCAHSAERDGSPVALVDARDSRENFAYALLRTFSHYYHG